MATPKIPRVAARYVGAHRRVLAGGPHFDGAGKRRETRHLERGDTLLMPATEVLGQTVLFDPAGVRAPEWLGIGRVVKPEHVAAEDGHGRTAEELQALGYEFSEGRGDFEPAVDLPPGVVPLRPPAPAEEPDEDAFADVLGGLLRAAANGGPVVVQPARANGAGAKRASATPAAPASGAAD